MKYNINNKRKGIFLPRIDAWVMDDLELKLLEAQIYSIILQKGFLVWNSEYLAYILKCSSKTVLRTIDKLVEKDVCVKSNAWINGRNRYILVALYTEKGRRSDSEVQSLLKQGRARLLAGSEH